MTEASNDADHDYQEDDNKPAPMKGDSMLTATTIQFLLLIGSVVLMVLGKWLYDRSQNPPTY